jgi:hypothetical protein
MFHKSQCNDQRIFVASGVVIDPLDQQRQHQESGVGGLCKVHPKKLSED